MRSVSVEEIVDFPLPGTGGPAQFGFAPDGRHLVYLDDPRGGLSRQLFALDPTTGRRRPVFQPAHVEEAELPLEEKLRRERLRERDMGVTRVIWAPKGEQFLVPVAGGLWLQSGLDGAARPLIDRAQDPTWSPDATQIAFVRDGEVFVVSTAPGSLPRQITSGEAGRTRGVAEYIAQEEMGRMRGYWWAPDSRRIAFIEVDAAHIPDYRIVHQGADALQWEDHAYPFAGADNAHVRLGVVSLDDGSVRWLPLSIDGGTTDDLYLARVRWTEDGALWAEVQDRRQQRLELVRYDTATAAAEVVLVETTPVWINLHHLFHGLSDGGFLWGSERTGFMHLYRYDRQGRLLGALSSGDWMVEQLVAVEEDKGLLYVLGTHDDPRERHLYALALDSRAPALRRITPAGGFHTATLSPRRGQFIDTWSRIDAPPEVTLRELATGAVLQVLHTPADPRTEGLAPPELVEVTTRDGERLYGALFRPAGPGPFPTLISVYGGPHAQRVQAGWHLTVDMRAQHLRSQGFAVLKLDNRGSARRGLAFEGAIQGNMGDLEVQDQVDGVRWLVAQGIADPARVGIYGWSYGGYMTLMALARAPETFRAGAAGAPVTHWDTYDTHYTERYMGLPQENPEGYRVSSVMAHIDALRGDLLLIHGLIDENVLFRHTARLINALNRQRKRYDLLLFPDERHMPRGKADLIYLETRIREFFQATLRSPPPSEP